MWGTDYPLIEHGESLSQIGQYDLKPEAVQALLRDVAVKVFRLDPAWTPPGKAAATVAAAES
jgi:predicted TIM-barrel fold metal-dependent hydrolase